MLRKLMNFFRRKRPSGAEELTRKQILGMLAKRKVPTEKEAKEGLETQRAIWRVIRKKRKEK